MSGRLRGLTATGLIATLAAMATTTLAAALAQAVGVDFEVPDSGETIPLSGFAVVTGFFSVVGIAIAAGLRRWSARPAERFAWTAASLTAISLLAPLLAGANTATTTALLGLHLIPRDGDDPHLGAEPPHPRKARAEALRILRTRGSRETRRAIRRLRNDAGGTTRSDPCRRVTRARAAPLAVGWQARVP